MQKKSKIIVAIVAIPVIGVGIMASIRWSQRELVTVQTSKVVRSDITSIVTASGEIKPRNYINLGANAQGPLTDILVKEGDRVRKNQVVARIENTQAAADVRAQRAAVASSEADSAASEAAIKVQEDAIKSQAATVEKARSELARAKIQLDRGELLFKQQLSPRQDYDQRKADYDSASAAVREAEAHLTQMESQRAQNAAVLTSSQRRITQSQANLARLDNVLARFDVVSPIDGLVTYLPVRMGETVVPGIQNSAASTIMTIADMSLITAEVKVDETDIVNVDLDQVATVTIDAMPNRTFTGKVIEIGNTAMLRSTGLAASQSNTSAQEAKDFKVVIALENPPDELRPGLSCSAKIGTAERKKALTIPIQALTVRTKGDMEDKKTDKTRGNDPLDPIAEKARKEEIQGVFVVKNDKAEFRKVDTGITGATEIEVLSGLDESEQIITGSYKAIRSIRNGTRVKVDNKSPVADDSKS